MKFGPIVGIVQRNENTKFEQVLTIRVDGGIFQSWRNLQKSVEIDLNKY